MSIRAMTLVWERSRSKGSNRLILLAIADYAKDDGTNAYPSNSALAKKSLLTTRAVQQLLRKLEKDHEIRTLVIHGRRHLEIRCVTDWPHWPPQPDDVQGTANFAGGEKFSQGLTPEGSEGMQSFRDGLPDPSGGGMKSRSYTDPLLDPLFELLQSDDDRSSVDGPVETVENLEIPDAERAGSLASPRFLLKLAHTVLAAEPNAELGDVNERLRTWLSQHAVAYTPVELEKALSSARWQQRLPKKGSAV